MSPRRPAAGGGIQDPRAGLTLLELLIVMSLLALVLGVGAGSLANLDPGRRTALSTVTSTLRLARNEAVARRAPARVTIDRATGRLQAEGLRVVGTWRFEDEGVIEGFGPPAELLGGDVPRTDAGHIGKALDFAAGPPAGRLAVALEEDPACDPRDGFALELALRVQQASGTRVADLGGSAGLDLRSDGSLVGWFIQEVVGATGRGAKGGRIRLESAAGVVPVGRWCRLRLEYDRRVLRALVDDVEVGIVAAEGRVWEPEGSLLVGGGTGGLMAQVDDLVLSVVSAGDAALLPAGVTLKKDSPTQVHFTPTGSLDPRQHPAPLELVLEYDDGDQDTIRVGLYGTVEG